MLFDLLFQRHEIPARKIIARVANCAHPVNWILRDGNYCQVSFSNWYYSDIYLLFIKSTFSPSIWQADDGHPAMKVSSERVVSAAIPLKPNNTPVHRPQTHDLIQNILEAFDSEILRIEVTDIRDNTYYALIYVEVDRKEMTIDSRPSNAIVVALAVGAPIYVRERLLYRAKTVQLKKDMDEDQLKEFLESLNPEEFRYKA